MSLVIRIPNILKIASPLRYCPKNKFLEVGQESRAWINSYATNKITTFDSNQFDVLSAFMFPLISKKNFRLACDLNNWFFFYDEVAETSKDSERISEEVLRSIENLSERNGSAFGKCTRDILRRIEKVSSQESFKRLKENLAEYVAEVPEESKWYREGTLVSLEQCCKKRSLTIGFKPSFILNSILLEIELEKNLFDAEIHQAFVSNAAKLGFLINDLISYPKDYVDGSNINIVSILMRERNLNHQEAIEEAAKLIKDGVQIFLSQRAIISQKFSSIQSNLEEYLNSVEFMIQGTSKFDYESDRYIGQKICNKFSEKLKRDLKLNDVKIIFE